MWCRHVILIHRLLLKRMLWKCLTCCWWWLEGRRLAHCGSSCSSSVIGRQHCWRVAKVHVVVAAAVVVDFEKDTFLT
uniref:Secreted protein n=1 Tax=Meloidogyne incognita TaxID=6306 RepID=A0A914M381_MELIC